MKSKSTFKILSILLIPVLFISGCANGNYNNIGQDVNAKYLFNRYTQKVEIYDLKTNDIKGKLYDDTEMFQYEFPCRDYVFNYYKNRLFTSGHNIYNRFEIFKLSDGKIERQLIN